MNESQSFHIQLYDLEEVTEPPWFSVSSKMGLVPYLTCFLRIFSEKTGRVSGMIIHNICSIGTCSFPHLVQLPTINFSSPLLSEHFQVLHFCNWVFLFWFGFLNLGRAYGFPNRAPPQLQCANGNKSFQGTVYSLDLGTEGLEMAIVKGKIREVIAPRPRQGLPCPLWLPSLLYFLNLCLYYSLHSLWKQAKSQSRTFFFY